LFDELLKLQEANAIAIIPKRIYIRIFITLLFFNLNNKYYAKTPL